MSHPILRLVAVIALPLAAVGQDPAPPPAAPTLKVADVSAAPGDWIVLRADTPGKTVKWKAVDKGIRLAPPELSLRDPHVALATANAPGVYRVHAVTAAGDLPSEIVEFKVTVAADPPDPPPAPPVPPTPPVPPAPVDPLAGRVQAALAADAGTPADKKAWAVSLAGFYSAMAAHVNAGQTATVGDLLNDYRAAIPTILPDTAVPGTRKQCGAEVAAVAGDNTDAPVDAALKAKLVDLFTRLSAALLGS